VGIELFGDYHQRHSSRCFLRRKASFQGKTGLPCCEDAFAHKERVPFHYQQAQVLTKAVFRTADGLREHHPEIN
jgi:hypothetical protein